MELVESETEYPVLNTDYIISFIEKHGDSISLIILSGVQYYTGQFFDIAAITAAGHRKQCVVGWDLAHAVGNVPLSLHDWNVDFACWCSYKYLNSGPGNIGGCFVHTRHNTANPPVTRLAGWWGHELSTRFMMNEKTFSPIPSAHGFRLSNPPVLCVATLLASLEVFARAGGVISLRVKSELLTAYLFQLLTEQLHFVSPHSASQFNRSQLTILTPSDYLQRGCQLSLMFPPEIDVVHLDRVLVEKYGVVCDVRKPNVLRISPTPLYNSFTDVFQCVQILKEILGKKQ